MRIVRETHLTQLTVFPGWFPVNVYLVEEEQELTLIDAGIPVMAKAILQAAQSIGKPITRILLTHAHDDHVGALDKLKAELPDVRVYISRRDSRLLAGDRTLEPGEPDTPVRGGVPKKVRTRPDVLLNDGDNVGSLLAVSAPGHTPGSMAFFDRRHHYLIAGDALQTRGGVAVSGQWVPWFPFPAMATWDKRTALESARKLEALNPSLLAVGHGNIVKQPEEVMNRAIREAEIRLGGKGGPSEHVTPNRS
ncbi:Glyoxylase, beta-lactamase superfamily II [Paenibacillus sp. UNCCL117]|uniref:MBL fold metallo-hydrolase n=1 Tax=unclassified Paenibacillus TaxID=185978 RepID=UPI000887AF54|nr:MULTISPECIES: MBL fold metallo-hydrolase [unclassified Paenibacillus]SDC90198.1 Glyoxylase, beta-lactamase superfamily II [Paenibacillus sp. cl123]SFW28766.1 Glyoxylase, beta-lactamase superfamily II [Paenibacillus sp. UNCCL117]